MADVKDGQKLQQLRSLTLVLELQILECLTSTTISLIVCNGDQIHGGGNWLLNVTSFFSLKDGGFFRLGLTKGVGANVYFGHFSLKTA